MCFGANLARSTSLTWDHGIFRGSFSPITRIRTLAPGSDAISVPRCMVPPDFSVTSSKPGSSALAEVGENRRASPTRAADAEAKQTPPREPQFPRSSVLVCAPCSRTSSTLRALLGQLLTSRKLRFPNLGLVSSHGFLRKRLKRSRRP